jgi:hypothetical protein
LNKIVPLTKELQKELKEMKIKVENFLKNEKDFARKL